MIKAINVISDTNIGGAGKCVLTFAKYYSKEKIDLVVVIPKDSLLKAELQKLDVRIIELDGLADKSLDLASIGKLKKIFEVEKPDIVHCHAAMSARIAARLYRKAKIIYTRHSVFEPSKTISKGLGKLINGAINNFTADQIIAVADAAKDNLIKTGVDKNKIIVIQNGVEPLKELGESEKRQIMTQYDLTDNDFVLGICARLNEVKGHIYILEAVKKLVTDGINAKLIIAGTGDYEPVIRSKISELGIENNVIMAGFISDVAPIMNIISASVNASFGTEATSLALLEGMSLGVPAVVSDFGGNPGVIDDGINGYIFKSQDSDDMYKKLKKLYCNKDNEHMKGHCKQQFDMRFRAEIMTQKTQNLYFGLCGKE